MPAGSNLARRKRIVKVHVKVQNTGSLLYQGPPTTQGGALSTARELVQPTIDTFNFDSATPLYSGVLEIEDAATWDREIDQVVTFTQADPLPFYLMYLDVEMADKSGSMM